MNFENGTTYVRYKKATNASAAFLKWLSETIPSVWDRLKGTESAAPDPSITSWAQPKKTTSVDIARAAVFIAEQKIPVPPDVEENLSTAIRLRKEVLEWMKNKDSADAGHSFFLNLLIRVRDTLSPCFQRRREKKGPLSTEADGAEENNVGLVNAFEVLKVDDEDTAVEEQQSEEEMEKPHRPASAMSRRGGKKKKKKGKTESKPKPVVLTEEEYDPDREWFACASFFKEMDKVMQKLVQIWKDVKAKKVSIVAATAATTASIEIITRMTSSVQLDFHYLKDLEHFVAVVYFRSVLNMIKKMNPQVSHQKALSAVTLCRHHNIADKSEDVEETLRQVMKLTGITRAEAVKIFDETKIIEFPLGIQVLWFSEYLGGSANIFFLVHAPLVYFAKLNVGEDESFYCQPGDPGEDWDETKRKYAVDVNSLRNYLYFHFMQAVVPVARKTKLPPEAIPPVVSMFKKLLETGVIQVQLDFIIHAMLWVIFVTSGSDKFVTKFGEKAGTACTNLFKSYSELLIEDKRISYILLQETKWHFKFFNLTQALTFPDCPPHANVLTSMWNPMLAGYHLASLHHASFEGGLHCMVSRGIVLLHMYNALRVLGKIESQAPLEKLLQLFSKPGFKWLWTAGQTQVPGQFLNSYYMAMGFAPREAAKRTSFLLKNFKGKPQSARRFDHDHGKINYRKFKAIKAPPELNTLLNSYRFIVKKDYTGLPPEAFKDSATLMDAVLGAVNDERSAFGLDMFKVSRFCTDVCDTIMKEVDGLERCRELNTQYLAGDHTGLAREMFGYIADLQTLEGLILCFEDTPYPPGVAEMIEVVVGIIKRKVAALDEWSFYWYRE
ncbi:hypothetical protein HDU96_005926 [Phlyctochytrium bullatum]|nr:hypothetical protein HDU96_005926 [Phlyctochytrium bullatum]